MGSVTFKARNGRVVPVDDRLWSLAQARTATARDGRLRVEDACLLTGAVEPEGDLPDQRRTLHHIRWYFRWTECGGKALLHLLTAGAVHHWRPDRLAETQAQARTRFPDEP